MPLNRTRFAGTLLRLVLATLFVSPGADTAPLKRTCSNLSNDTFAVDASPSVLALTFVGQSAYFLFDSGKSEPFLQYLPVSRTTRGCGSSDTGLVSQSPAIFLGSQSLVAADFNGDGIPDAASIDFAPTRVSIFLGDSSGALKPQASYVVGVSPQSVLAADFNADGKLDLAVANAGNAPSDPGSVAVLLGRGDGTFQPPISLRAGNGPVAVAAADMNRDGKLDLIAVNALSDSVSTFLGIGDGTFQIQREEFVVQGPVSVVVADFNGDRLPDLAVTNTVSNALSILLGNGDGAYRPVTSYNVGDEPGYLASADFNGDGKPDLAILFESRNALAILLGKGDGSFALPVNYAVGSAPTSLALADLDGDGVVDLLAPDPSSHSILILWGRSDGSFDAPPLYAVGSAPEAVAVGDFNGDGKADLVTPNLGSSDVSVLMGSGDGKFRAIQSIRLVNPDFDPRPAAIAVADFNGDGVPDLAVANGAPLNHISIQLGRGDGTFRAAGAFTTGPDPRSILVADFDGDGKLDIATANSNSFSNTDFGNVSVLLGNGDGTFRTAAHYPAGVHPRTVVTGDFNGDGKLDLVVGSSGDAAAKQPETISVLLGNGDGTFAPATYLIVGENPPARGTIASVAVADLNGDGKLDLVVTASSTIEVLTGAGDGTFQRAIYPTTSEARFALIEDIDGDGKLDVIVAHCCHATGMSYLAGNGDGTFQQETNFPGGASPVWAAVADFNSDGKPDLAIADSSPKGSVAILLNRVAASPGEPKQ